MTRHRLAHRLCQQSSPVLTGLLLLLVAGQVLAEPAPWESRSGRANPFDPPPMLRAPEPGAILPLTGLEPLPPVPVWEPAGPTLADRFQSLLSLGRMHGTVSLSGATRALVTFEGRLLQLEQGMRLKFGELELTVLEVAPEALVLSTEDGALVGLLPRDPDAGLRVDARPGRVSIRSVARAASE